MPDLLIRPSGPLRGAITIPGDKSITHRALMLGVHRGGRRRPSRGGCPPKCAWRRCAACRRSARRLTGRNEAGARARLRIRGKGLRGLTEPDDVLYCAGSGTTMRLLAGLAGGPAVHRDARRHGAAAPPADGPGGRAAAADGRDRRRRGRAALPPLTIRGGSLTGNRLHAARGERAGEVGHPARRAFCRGRNGRPRAGTVARSHRADAALVRRRGGDGRARRAAARRADAERRGRAPLVIPGDFSSAAFPLVGGEHRAPVAA